MIRVACHRGRHALTVALSLIWVVLGGCALPETAGPSAQSSGVAAAFLQPPAALKLEGVPPVPPSLVAQVARYNRFDSMGLVAQGSSPEEFGAFVVDEMNRWRALIKP